MTVYNSRLKMKDLPVLEQPYEKLTRFGAEMLSNAELLAIIIKTGCKSDTSVTLAQKLLKEDKSGKGLAFLHELSLEQLMKIRGIGRVKAIQIKAVMEFSKRITTAHDTDSPIVIKSPDDISRLLMEEMRHLNKEVFKVVLLNTKNHVIRIYDVSIGSLNASIVHPREVFVEVIKTSCSAVVFIHNHPSGDPQPSKEDIETTSRLVNAGNILGIKVLDHIILGNGRFVSLKEKGIM